MDFLTWLGALGREAWALFLLTFAGGAGLGAWWGFREGQSALEAGQAATLAELRASLTRLRSWLEPLEGLEGWLDDEQAVNLATLALREARAIDNYARDLEVRSLGSKWIIPVETRERPK